MSEKAVQVVEGKAVANYGEPVSAIERMISAGVKPEDLDKFLAVQERYEKNEAKKAYTQAMAAFKANPPTIIKDRTVAYKETRYNHASLGNVTKTINSGLGEYGLSAAWRTEQGDKGIITVTCTITHALGHSESTSLTASPDVSGSKNAIQAIGSTVSYLQRYTILALTGLATEEQDDDGNAAGAPPEFITEEQAIQLRDMAESSRGGMTTFLKYLKDFKPPINSIDEIPAGAFDAIFGVLKKAQK